MLVVGAGPGRPDAGDAERRGTRPFVPHRAGSPRDLARYRDGCRAASATRPRRHRRVHHAIDGRRQRTVFVVLEVDGAHDIHRLPAPEGRSEGGCGSGFGDQRQLGAIGIESLARAEEQSTDAASRSRASSRRERGGVQKPKARLLTSDGGPRDTRDRGGDQRQHRDDEPPSHRWPARPSGTTSGRIGNGLEPAAVDATMAKQLIDLGRGQWMAEVISPGRRDSRG